MTQLMTYSGESLSTKDFSQQDLDAFNHDLYQINQISIQLSSCKTLDELYQQAIVLARKKLGLDRVAILLIDEQRTHMYGTWGVGPKGDTRDESSSKAPLEDFVLEAVEAISSKGKVCVWRHLQLKDFDPDDEDNLLNIGYGWNAAVGFWENAEVIGWVACDNLIKQQPFKEYQTHIIRLFGSIIGELILLKRAEQRVNDLNQNLEGQVEQRTAELLLAKNKLSQANIELEERVLVRTEQLQQEKDQLQKTLDELFKTQNSLASAQQEGKTQSQHISMLEEVHKKLQHANKQAQQASQAKSDFLANISHELKTPLNAISGNIALCSDTRLTTEQGDYLQRADKATRSLQSMIENIITMSKSDNKEDDIDIEKLDLLSLITTSIATVKPLLATKNIELTCQIGARFPRYVYADEVKISTILAQLLDNAVKFTKQGKIEIVLQWHQSRMLKQGLLDIKVIDSGIGIEKSKLPMLFKRFTQVDASTSRKYAGTGVGLSLCQEMAEQLGGTISVESQLNSGSSFTLQVSLTTAKGDDDSVDYMQQQIHQLLQLESKLATNKSHSNVDKQQVQLLQKQLTEAIRDFDSSALSIAQSLYQSISQSELAELYETPLLAVIDALNNYDFDKAIEHLETLN